MRAIHYNGARDGGQHGGGDFAWASRTEERNRLWRARHNAYFAGLALRPGCRALTTDVCVPVSELAGCIEKTIADVNGLPFPPPLLGHVADGNFHLMLLIDPSEPGGAPPRQGGVRPAGGARARRRRDVHGRARGRARHAPRPR
jgi:FAD/FMN-containing dehydrogenase